MAEYLVPEPSLTADQQDTSPSPNPLNNNLGQAVQKKRRFSKKRIVFFISGILILLVLLANASKNKSNSVVTPNTSPTNAVGVSGGRVLSISANGPTDNPTSQDLLNIVSLLKTAHVNGEFKSVSWKDLEPSPGAIKPATLLAGLKDSGDNRGLSLLLTIKLIDTTSKQTPADLMGTSFDSLQMMSRFHKLLDDILPGISSKVLYISIGNEVDVYLSQNPSQWGPYKSFYTDAVTYIHKIKPGLKVGVTTTFGGASSTSASQVSDLNSISDFIALTYYPIQSDFTVQSVDSPNNDLPKMVGLAGSKQVVMQEVGYPSSAILNSSESKQTQFVKNLFTAWASQGNRIPFLNYFVLYDFSDTTCSLLSGYYAVAGNNFKAYLCTLGLRHNGGNSKPAWDEFVKDGLVK